MKFNHLIELQPNKFPFLYLENLVEVIPNKKVTNEYYLDDDLWFLNVIGKMIQICQLCFN